MKSALLPILIAGATVSLASSSDQAQQAPSRFIRGASRGGGLRGLKEKSTKPDYKTNNKPDKDTKDTSRGYNKPAKVEENKPAKDDNKYAKDNSSHRGYKPAKEDKVKSEKESARGNTAQYDREPVGVNKDYTNSGGGYDSNNKPEKSTKDGKKKDEKKYNGKTKQDAGRGKQPSEAETFAREEHDKRVDHGRVVDDYSKPENSQKENAERGGGKEKEEKNKKEKAERGGGNEKVEKNKKQKEERGGGKEKSEKNQKEKAERDGGKEKSEKNERAKKEEERPSDLNNEPQPIDIGDEGQREAQIEAKPEKSQEENGGEKKADKKAKETERVRDTGKPEKAEKNKKADQGGGKESKASDAAPKESAQVSTPGWEPTPMPVEHTTPAPVEPTPSFGVNTPVPSVSPTEDTLLAPPAADATEIPTNDTLGTPAPTEDTLVDSTPVASPAVTTVPATSEETTTVAATEAAAESTETTVSATEAAAAPPAIPSCPLRYNPQTTSYSAGDQIEMSDHIFTCQDIPYEPYCDIEYMDPSWDATVKELWVEAWALVGPCEVGEAGEDVLLTTIAATEAAVQPAPETESTTGSSTTSATTTATAITTTTSTTELLTTTSTTELLTTIAATAAAVQPVPDTTTTTTSTTTTSTTTTPAPSPGPTPSPTPAPETSPSLSPTYAPTPTMTTYSPTESPPECPEPYDDTSASNYKAGDQVEASQHIFECRGGEYEYYCNIPTWDANLLEENPNAEELWNGAWTYVGPCEISVATFTSEGEVGGGVDTLVVTTDGGEYVEEEEWYTLELSSSCELKYQLNADEGSVSFEVVHMDGEAWVGLAFNSGDGKMVASEAVIGIPLDNTVQKYDLGGKSSGAITPMPESQQTLTNASIEVVDGTTTMKFTKLLVEANEIEISTGHNTMLYAHGTHNGGFGYHGPDARRVFELTLSLEGGWGR